MTELPPRNPDTDSASERDGPQIAFDIRSLALTVLALVAGTLFLQYAGEILIPIALSVLISFTLDPIVTWLSRWKIPRSVSAALLLLLVVGGMVWTAYALQDELAAALERIPAAARTLRHSLRDVQRQSPGTIEKLKKAAGELEKTAAEATKSDRASGDAAPVTIQEAPIKLTDYLWWGSKGAAAMAGEIVMVLFLVYFMLVSGDLYKRKLVKLAGPSMSRKRMTVEILDDICGQIQRFLVALLLANLSVAVASWLAFRWVGLEQAAVWGIAAGLFNSIPYFGPVLVAGGVAVVAFLQFGTLYEVALLVGLTLLITSLEGYLLTPWLMGRAAQMNAVAVFIGLLFWGWVWGAWGLFLAIPLLMIVKVVCDHTESLHSVGEWLGE
jgi:predicted PurR-regulated permease PerM